MHDATTAPPAPYRVYAGFRRRLASTLIDGAILFIPALLLDRVTFQIGGLALELLFVVFFVCSNMRATPGMIVVGIQLVTLDGKTVSVEQAVGRFFASLLSGAILLIGYFMYFWSPRRQTLHDQLARTLVVERPGPQLR
jgi:uncharacterized RDD family membrane protein YckC